MRGVYKNAFQGRYAVVGISLFHTVGDRERALDQINTGFRTLNTEVMTMAGWNADPYHPAEGPIWDWWSITGVPVMEEWQKFYADQWGSYSTRWASNWEEYERWQERLVTLRNAAVAHGLKLITPPPAPLGATLPGKIIDKTGCALDKAGHDIEDTLTGLMKVLKYTVYGALGVGALVAVASVASNVRKGTDPVEKYADIYRRTRR